MADMFLSSCRRWVPIVIACSLLAALASSGMARPAGAQSNTPNPDMVTIAGTLQSELGCASDWMPSCDKTFLTYDAASDVWRGAFNVQPNDDQDKKGPRYKAALNGSWNENYGLKAQVGGADIPLIVPQAMTVRFYYDHKTHW